MLRDMCAAALRSQCLFVFFVLSALRLRINITIIIIFFCRLCAASNQDGS